VYGPKSTSSQATGWHNDSGSSTGNRLITKLAYTQQVWLIFREEGVWFIKCTGFSNQLTLTLEIQLSMRRLTIISTDQTSIFILVQTSIINSMNQQTKFDNK
jgi:hypothetical protein